MANDTAALAELSDAELAEEAREREIDYQNALGEIDRRRTDRGQPEWSEGYVAACLARKRVDITFHPHVGERHPTDLPPPLFRMGYEWAVLTIAGDLERILERPSEDIALSQEFEPTSRGLYRKRGQPKVQDFRRRAALDLIRRIEDFGRVVLRGMFYVLPPRRSDFKPSDSDERRQRRPQQGPESKLVAPDR